MTPRPLAQKKRPYGAVSSMNSTEVRLHLSCGPDAVAAARHGLDGLEGEVGPERLHDMRLLVSGVVTNSVRHAASGELILEVSISDETIHVAVTDGGPGFEVA